MYIKLSLCQFRMWQMRHWTR